jgi:hypothetical protein
MAQFGAGLELAAQCPRVGTPDGWRAWLSESDGPIPDALAKRAQALVDDAAVPLGVTESYPLPGVTTLIRVEPRVWGRDEKGDLVQGCFRAGGVYLPSGSPPAETITSPEVSTTSKIIGALTIASLAVGTVATLATWGKG